MHSGKPRLFADSELGRLHAEGVGGAAAVALEVDAPVEVVVEDRVEVILADSLNVVDLLRADVVLIEQPALARMEEVYA